MAAVPESGGRNIYIRPSGGHDLTLIDDLAPCAIRSMKETGFDPAVVVETSPGNYQAWLKHPERLNKRSEHWCRVRVGPEIRE